MRVPTASPLRSGANVRASDGVPRAAVDVVGIGVQKSATSWLYRCLVQHPGVRGARGEGGTKELNFFNHRYEYGLDWYESLFDIGSWRNMEFSVLYFHDRNVPERLKAYNPEARLIVCLRNPVDRALSQYRHEIRHGRIPYRPGGFWHALERNPSYVEQGRYATHLERWLTHFSREQLHIVEYDAVKEDPEGVVSGTLQFLGFRDEFRPSLVHRRANRSVVQGKGVIQRGLHLGASALRLMIGRKRLRSLRESAWAQRIQDMRYDEVGGQAELLPGDPMRDRLADLFSEELERLGSLLGGRYEGWR